MLNAECGLHLTDRLTVQERRSGVGWLGSGHHVWNIFFFLISTSRDCLRFRSAHRIWKRVACPGIDWVQGHQTCQGAELQFYEIGTIWLVSCAQMSESTVHAPT